MPTVYGDGTLYGDALAFYGRIGSALVDAQTAQVRSTGLKVSIIDERSNRWEDLHVSGTINAGAFRAEALLVGDNDDREPDYWAYRSPAHLAVLGDGTIVRVRIGAAGDYSDRQIYVQEITDPSVDTEWEAWTLLYSGTHYAVAVVSTGASTYDVFHTKAGVGFCRNNSVEVATADDGEDLGRGIRICPTPSADYFMVTVPAGSAFDNDRVLNLYAVDTTSNQAFFSYDNMEWARNSLAVIEDPNSDNWLEIRSFPLHQNPRVQENGESITVLQVLPERCHDLLTNPPRIIRGLTGRAGHNIINLANAYVAEDGFTYLFYYEYHTDDDFHAIQNSQFIFWQRSKDGLHWSEPVLIGFYLNGFAGVFESGGYMYAAGNGSVIRRPTIPVVYDITNYVPALSYDLPRSNEEGSGTVRVANPAGINDNINQLSDRRIVIEPGLMIEGGAYEHALTGDFWIKNVQEETSRKASRLNLAIGDVWSRLSEPLRDTFNIIGQTEWNDWEVGGINESFNYYFDSGEPTLAGTGLRLAAGGTALWTGWKGHNPDFSVDFSNLPVLLYARWVDVSNHLKFHYTSSVITCYSVVDGVETDIGNVNVGASQSRIRIIIKWNQIKIYSNGVLRLTIDPDPLVTVPVQPGYVGFGSTSAITFSRFHFIDWEYSHTTHDLVRFALAMGDYHDVITGGPSEKQYAMIWGPQTDIPSAADGLRQVLESVKLELIWRDGRIEVGQFKDTAPIKVLQDEIFETTFTDEAKRRINLAIVDGNEHSWIEGDGVETRARDRQIVAYFDLPELLTQDAVRERSQEEIRLGKKGQSPGGRIPLMLDLWRMDPITWIDNIGRIRLVRIEGIRVSIRQDQKPSQFMELDTSLI